MINQNQNDRIQMHNTTLKLIRNRRKNGLKLPPKSNGAFADHFKFIAVLLEIRQDGGMSSRAHMHINISFNRLFDINLKLL